LIRMLDSAILFIYEGQITLSVTFHLPLNEILQKFDITLFDEHGAEQFDEQF
jgi:hypothetical protein